MTVLVSRSGWYCAELSTILLNKPIYTNNKIFPHRAVLSDGVSVSLSDSRKYIDSLGTRLLRKRVRQLVVYNKWDVNNKLKKSI